MAFSTQAIRYGWVALVGVAITGTTIYVSSNQRHQVEQIDIIELVLGTTERCLATQTTTNPTYLVTPPSFVRSWFKDGSITIDSTATNWAEIWSQQFGVFRITYNSYWPNETFHEVCYTTKCSITTSGGSGGADYFTDAVISFNYASAWAAEGGYVWTNVVNPHIFIYDQVAYTWSPYSSEAVPIVVSNSFQSVTNTIGWHTDKAMMISLDGTIKTLIPYYVDSNTVYDGTTNIVMLTVTGLWDSLGLGDKTNQFTRTFASTNTATNYPVCYTQDTSTLVYDHSDVEDITTNGVRYYTVYYRYTTNSSMVTQSYVSVVSQEVNSAIDHYGEEYCSFSSTGPTWNYHYYKLRMIYVYTNFTFASSQVETTTNNATYGDYPWPIRSENLEERYKVLNACEMNSPSTRFTGHRFHCRARVQNGYEWYAIATNWQTTWPVSNAMASCESTMQMMIDAAAADEDYATNVWSSFWGGYVCTRLDKTAFAGPMIKQSRVGYDHYWAGYRSDGAAEMWIDHLKVDNFVYPPLSGTFYLYVNPTESSEETCSPWTTGVWTKVASSSFISNSLITSGYFYDTSLPSWHSEHLDPWPPGRYGNSYYKGYSAALYPFYKWSFNYCKTKYW